MSAATLHPRDVALALARTIDNGKRTAATTALLAALDSGWDQFVSDVEAGRIADATDRVARLAAEFRGPQ